MGQSLETAVTLQGQVQTLAAKAVTSKGSRTALPTLQRATHSFSWAACDFRSKLGPSCDTPGASIQAVLPAKAVPSKGSRTGLPNASKGPAQLFHGQLATLGQSLDTAVTLQGQVQAAFKGSGASCQGFKPFSRLVLDSFRALSR